MKFSVSLDFAIRENQLSIFLNQITEKNYQITKKEEAETILTSAVNCVKMSLHQVLGAIFRKILAEVSLDRRAKYESSIYKKHKIKKETISLDSVSLFIDSHS